MGGSFDTLTTPLGFVKAHNSLGSCESILGNLPRGQFYLPTPTALTLFIPDLHPGQPGTNVDRNGSVPIFCRDIWPIWNIGPLANGGRISVGGARPPWPHWSMADHRGLTVQQATQCTVLVPDTVRRGHTECSTGPRHRTAGPYRMQYWPQTPYSGATQCTVLAPDTVQRGHTIHSTAPRHCTAGPHNAQYWPQTPCSGATQCTVLASDTVQGGHTVCSTGPRHRTVGPMGA